MGLPRSTNRSKPPAWRPSSFAKADDPSIPPLWHFRAAGRDRISRGEHGQANHGRL